MAGKRWRTAALVSLALVVAGCTSSDEPSAPDDASAGGTLYALVPAEEVTGLDPQRIYSVEGFNLATSFLLRSLVMLDPDDEGSTSGLLPDLATDTGRPNEDASVWQFTLRDGATFEDGTAVECEHVAYGVSRSFALDVITDGPTWVVDMLDIPVLDDGTSAYKGPYTAEGQDFFDEAVTCEGSTITFRLKQPQGDFNQVAAFPALGPVKPEADTGEGYNDAPLATGPYRVEGYDKGQRLVLVRNGAWDPATDPHRPAHPDRVEFVLGLGPAAIDEQIITGSGNGRFAVPAGGGMQASNLERVFSDDSMADRRLDVLDPFVTYVAINTNRVPVLEHRQAILAAVNRSAILTASGGTFAGEEADGVVKPTLADDYAPTELWTGLLGRDVPPEGDPDLARELIEASGEPMPELVFDYPSVDDGGDRSHLAFLQGLTDAGIPVQPNPIPPNLYYGTVLDPAAQGHLSWGGWGPDWANASTVIAPLFGAQGSFNLSRVNQGGLTDESFQAAIEQGLSTADRQEQAQIWQDLNRRAMELALVAPTLFTRTQTMWGSGLGGVEWSDAWGATPLLNVYVRDGAQPTDAPE